MNVIIGGDHRGLELKKSVMQLISQMGHSCQDAGSYTDEPVDYPDIAREVAEAVTEGESERGILICDTGIGMCIAANKVKGIRAALCHNAFTAARARQHNDANILCLAATGNRELVPDILDTFLTTQFEGGRHQRRLSKIEAMESKQG